MRFIGNYSSGKMGYAIAEELARQGAKVLLVSGPVSVSTREEGIQVIHTESAEDMYRACLTHFPDCDGAVMAAAVADFTPSEHGTQKTKHKGKNLTIELKPTKDIAHALGKIKKENQILVGFALETHDELSNAQKKLKKKNFDFIVLNSLKDEGAGFGTDTNKITIISKSNKITPFELKSKKEVAADIVEMIISILPE
ncbi:MAG: phosphopantothenoylcysteine decarboxylase [Mariniphaga sp.]|nr:phosphopantothenoylcysteine decarboxylase [Mariniphaga sp.]